MGIAIARHWMPLNTRGYGKVSFVTEHVTAEARSQLHAEWLISGGSVHDIMVPLTSRYGRWTASWAGLYALLQLPG